MEKAASVPDLVAAGLSESFAHHVLAGTRSCSMPVALWLHEEHGLLVPQLAGKTKHEIDVLRNIFPASPPSLRRKRSIDERVSSTKRSAA